MADKQTREYESRATDARRRAAAVGDQVFRMEWIKVAEMWELLASEHCALKKMLEPSSPDGPG